MRADRPVVAATHTVLQAAKPPPRPRVAGQPSLLDLQRAAGNAAVTALIGGPVVQREHEARPGDVDQAANDLYGWLVANAVKNEQVLTTILLQYKGGKPPGPLEQAYDSKFHRPLRKDLEKLGSRDTIRALRYLDYGTLRPADKLYLAINGAFTDMTTVRRILPDLRATRVASEKDFTETYAAAYPADEKLPSGENSRIAGALLREMLWARFSERFEALAILAYGAPRPADDVKIATVDGPTGIQDARLFAALQRDDIATVRDDFQKTYGHNLKDYLARELYFHTKDRAVMLADPAVNPADRLIETVRIATSGYTTADWDFIKDAAQRATPEQIIKFKAAVATKDGRLKNMRALLGGMNEDQAGQLDALLNVDDPEAMANDPTVKMIRREAGATGDALFEALRNSTGAAHAIYKDKYLDEKQPLRRFVDRSLHAAQMGWLQSYVFIRGKDGFDALKARLRWIMTNPGHDDYALFLLSSFGTGADRKRLAADAEFGTWFTAMSTAFQNRALLVMQPESMTPQERAVWLDAAVKRETSSGAGALTKASEALTDENRELQAARRRIAASGKPPTPAEQAELDRLAKGTESALTAFVSYRDQFEAAVSSLVEIAASLVVALATGGAGVEVVAMAIARAAAASAMSKVIARKVALGDRFDVIGADGAAAFVSGAVDGALNVIGGALAKSAAGGALEEAASSAARSVGQKGAQNFAQTTGARMAEGAFTGGAGAAVDAAVQDKTWADGFDKGMRSVLEATAKGAAAGALPPAFATALTAFETYESFAAIVDAMPPGQATLEKIEVGKPDAAVSKLAESVAVQRQNWGKEYEAEVDRQARLGLLEGLPKMTFMIPGAHNGQDNGIDRIGVVLHADGTMTVYHFEMKWRNPPKAGRDPSVVELNTPPGLGKVQAGGAWVTNAVEMLCGPGEVAMTVRGHIRTMLAMTSGRRGDAVSDQEVLTFLRGSVTARRVVAIPEHVDDRRLMKQIAALIRWGVDVTVVRSRAPDPSRWR